MANVPSAPWQSPLPLIPPRSAPRLRRPHVPWVIPATIADAFLVAYPAKRFRSALFSIAVHSI